MTTVLGLSTFQTAAAKEAAPPTATKACPGPVVDDFSSGAYRRRQATTGIVDHTENGRMLGGSRFTRFDVGTTSAESNPYGMSGSLAIGPNGAPVLVVNSDYRVFHGLQVIYGLRRPLNADLDDCYDRFRIHFAGSDLGLNLNMQVLSANNPTVAQCGYNVPGRTGAFVVEFPFKCFVPNAGALPDFGRVQQIRVLPQSASAIGGNDYAMTKIELASAG